MATEWSTRMIVQAVVSAAGADEKTVTKAVENVKFPWPDDNGGFSDKPSDEDIIAAGGDPDNEFWWIETGDLSAADKNAGKNIAGLSL